MNEHAPPPGAPPLRRIEELSPDECRRLLTTKQVGRVVFVDARGPVALPVNYVLDDHDILFRTSAASSLLASSYAGGTAFEVDHVDEANRIGWSVLASGRVRQVTDPADRRHAEMLGVSPWAEGDRSRYLRLHVRTVTGRRLVERDES